MSEQPSNPIQDPEGFVYDPSFQESREKQIELFLYGRDVAPIRIQRAEEKISFHNLDLTQAIEAEQNNGIQVPE
ncbi:MAG: hypothetical protein V1487_03840 [bacterium]